MLAGIDSAQALTPAMLTGAATALRQPVNVRTTYLDAFGGGKAEVALAHAHGAAVLLCANSTSPAMVQGTLEDGVRYGEAQALLARSLGAPRGTLLAFDIEASWQPQEAWIGGVATGIVEAGYTPCAYCSLRAPATTNALLAAHLHWLAVREHLGLWAATPCLRSGGAWPGGLPSGSPDSLPGYVTWGWQFAENIALPNGGTVDLDLWQDATPGLWRPPAATTSSAVSKPPAPDLSAVAASLAQAQTAIVAAQGALRA